MIDETLQEQASLYVLGGLNDAERDEFESRLTSDAELRRCVAEFSDITTAMAGACPLKRPSARLKARIMEAVELEDDDEDKIISFPTPSGGMNRITWLVGTLAACLAVFAWMSSRESALQGRLEELKTITLNLQTATNDLHQVIDKLQEANHLSNLRIAMLSSQLKDQPSAVGVSMWDDQNQAGVIVVQHLQPLKEGDYQLWLVDPQYEHPVDGGVFQVDADGNARVEYKTKQHVATTKAFAITKEVKGGVAVSKGPFILAGG